ncbi:MAG: 50S ribosomal protein L13 [Candidatus Aenigmarchaeota archaeon]|nr:50S ribosomal protein L13 [Candidatus Aenigmarchaeota archaeon]
MIIDAKDAVLGRLSTFVAKKLLEEEKIHIVNSEKAIITGNNKKIFEKYLQRRHRGDVYKGPFFPKKPNMIVRRTIAGMLPKNKRGRNAIKRLKVYIGIPEKFKDKKIEKFDNKKNIRTSFVRIEKISQELGWSE